MVAESWARRAKRWRVPALSAERAPRGAVRSGDLKALQVADLAGSGQC